MHCSLVYWGTAKNISQAIMVAKKCKNAHECARLLLPCEGVSIEGGVGGYDVGDPFPGAGVQGH